MAETPEAAGGSVAACGAVCAAMKRRAGIAASSRATTISHRLYCRTRFLRASPASQPDYLSGQYGSHRNYSDQRLVFAVLAVELAGESATAAGGAGEPRQQPRHASGVVVEAGKMFAQIFFLRQHQRPVDGRQQ